MKQKLFDETSKDENELIEGDTTKILNLEETKFPWARSAFDTLFSNNWIPEKVDMTQDAQQFKNLTEDEQEAYKTVLSFLVFMDSIQTNNLPNIAEHITAPEVTMVLARQTYDEALHSLSYGHIGQTVFTHEEFQDLVYKWRETDENGSILLKRINNITQGYEEFLDNYSVEEFILIAVKNYLLEGLYFYNGFFLFHNFAARGLMIGSQTIIKYIQRDEIVHCMIFANILKELKEKYPDEFQNVLDKIYDLFREAVDLEVLFSTTVIGNKILGMTVQSITDYAHFLGNKRLRDIKLDAIFPKAKNPYTHLDMIAGAEDETTSRANNFEVTSTNYKTMHILDGWSEI